MKTRKLMMLALGLALLVTAEGWAGEVYNFTGGVKTRADQGLSKQELAPTPTDGGFFSWTYTFMCLLDDDSSIMIQFTWWKLYVKTERGLYFSYSDKGDKLYIRQELFEEEDMKYTADPPEFKMGGHYWKGYYPEFTVHVDFPAVEGEPEMKGDIVFKCRTPGWRPGDGPTHYVTPDGDWYDLVVMIPWADVEGTVTIAGQTKKIKGFGYSDHNTQNVMPTTQMDKLIALRSFSDDYSINFLEYIAPADLNSARTTWLLIMKDHEIIYATDKWDREMSDMRAEPKRGYKYPAKVTVKIDQPDCKLTGEIRAEKYIGMLDAMDRLPDFLRAVAEKFVSAAAFIRYNVAVDWHLVMPEKGIDDTFTARGVFETTMVSE